MSTDDEFVRHLRDRADAVPTVPVDTSRVLPRARRRRAATRTAGAGAVAVLVVAGVVVGQAWAGAPWRTGPAQIAPAVTATVEPTPGPTPAPTPTGATTTGTATTGTAQGAAPYWYVLSVTQDADGEHRSESWSSRERPGLLMWDGDLTNLAAMGPTSVVGRFRIDGEWVDMLRDPARLPTEPAALEAVLRDSVEPDRRSGSDDDKVHGMTHDLLLQGGTLPTDLLVAVWQVAKGLPGSTVTVGTDSIGRPGEILEYAASEGGVERTVVDPATGLVLEMGSADHPAVVHQGPADSVPVEPTLEMAGCTAWETC
ncbi:hypothetical protein [Cellulomonas hominis]|uniref:hypothetical protein n=1 Tax=Cellulomonas hominis TaxID=156981 RepID=UPI001B9CEC81|nr:hypothetical protein [Cellulomonas hominis]VTR77106.1 hypothetical protein CHMI_01874 [Cellulomonas hominis]